MNDNTAHTFSCISYSYFLQFCLVSICQRSLICFELSLTDFAYAASISILTDAVENNGFEPLTPCVQSRCSSQLS